METASDFFPASAFPEELQAKKEMGEFPVALNNNGSYNPYDAQIRSFGGPMQQGGGLFNESPYPGLGGNPYAGGFGEFGPRPNLPIAPSANLPAAPGGAGAGAGGLLGGFNFNQLKTLVERMGGIDGILGTMTKVQKVVSSLQQMAPMLKLVMGSFGKAATKNAGQSGTAPVRRKRRKKRAGPTYKGVRPAVRRPRR